MRAAAERDAAEIVARARREIRRIVIDARHELVELQAQAEAAHAALAGATAARDAAVREAAAKEVAAREAAAQEAAAQEAAAREAAAREATARETAAREAARDAAYVESQRHADPEATPAPSIWSDARTDAAAPSTDSFAFIDDRFKVAERAPLTPGATHGPARTFVALFTITGLAVLIGTFWWLTRPVEPAAAPASGVADVSSSASDAAAAIAATSPLTPPERERPAVVPASLALSLEARRPTWVRVIVDGEPDVGHTYVAGEARQIAGAGEVSIRAGDAGGLLVAVDGALPAPLGPDGVTLTRRFSRVSTPRASSVEPASERGVPPVSPESARTPPAPSEPVRTPSAPATAPARSTAAPAAATTMPPPPPQFTPVLPVPPGRSAGAPAGAVTPPGASASRPSSAARFDVAASSRQWLDAYHRQDRVSIETLAAPSLIVTDERKATERFPFGLEVARAFEDEQLQLAGDSAQFSARMIERASTGAFVSRITQTWVRRSGEWQLQEARIAHEDQLPPAR